MSIKLIEKDLDKYQSKFDNALKRHLKKRFDSKINWSQFSITPKKKLIKPSYTFYSNDSIFSSVVKFKKMDLYIFGLSDSLNGSKYPQFNQHTMSLSFRKIDIKNSAIAFGKFNNKLCLLIRVEFDKKMKDIDIFNFRHKLNVYKINEMTYINFGFIDNFSEIIDNMLFFLKNIVINSKDYHSLKISSFPVNKFLTPNSHKNKSFFKKNDRTSGNLGCKICGGEVEYTYRCNPKFTNYAGSKKTICANCYAKILISYFKHRIGDKYTNKSYLISSLNHQDPLINFYINLAEKIGVISRQHEIEFNENLDRYDLFFKEIPKKMRLKKIPPAMKGISQIFTIIDNETLEQGDLSKDFKKLLFDSGLSEDYGWKIRKKLIREAKEQKLKKTYKNIRERINQLISLEYSKKDIFNIFDSMNQLNNITIGPKGEYDEHFKYKLLENNLSQHSGKTIKDILVNEIESNQLINEAQIETRVNQLIESNYNGDSIKEYLIFENSFLLNALVADLELKAIFDMLDELSCDLEYLIITPHSNNLKKLKLEICNISQESSTQNILNKYGFRKR